MSDLFSAGFANLPDYLGQHVLLSVSAILLGLILSLPLAVAAYRQARRHGYALVDSCLAIDDARGAVRRGFVQHQTLADELQKRMANGYA